jgi:hypothetical protein
MISINLSHRTDYVYHRSTDRTPGLLFLLDFALKRWHCRQWAGAIALLLQREGLTDG